MDLNSDPCEDFFQYACGTWNKMHPIPEDRSSISTFEVFISRLGYASVRFGFLSAYPNFTQVLSDQQQVILRAVLEEPIDERDNKATIKAKTFFKSCMDIRKFNSILIPLFNNEGL